MAPICAQPRAAPEPNASPILGLRVKWTSYEKKGSEQFTPNAWSPHALSVNCSDPLFSDPLEDRGDALAAADAHRDERVALLRALELVERLHGEDGSCGADRMAERHRAAVRIHFRRIQSQIPGYRHRLRSEGFVRFDHIHVGGLEPRFLEHFPHRG